MRNRLIIVLLCFSASLFAEERALTLNDTVRSTDIQTRIGATFTKDLTPNLSVYAEEEIRITAFEKNLSADSLASPLCYLNRLYTTVGLDYEPIPYLELGTGYTLKVYAQKGWKDADEVLRHRVFASVSGKYQYGNWRFSLRERLVVDMRTDSVNLLEKPLTELQLRHRFHVAYANKFLRWKPYMNVTLINSLNQPSFVIEGQRLGGQYLQSVRLMVGTKYNFTRNSALNIFYRFDTSWDNDFNITRKRGDLEYIRGVGFTHVIGIFYEFDW